jgi:23S rRNA (cytosine1962-C5)-methyltransferase
MSRVYCPFPENYELIDAGGGRKLERWGTVVTIRPENLAYFPAALTNAEWKTHADWEFVPDNLPAGKAGPASLNGKWKALKPGAVKSWIFHTNGIRMNLEITGNKHIGIFPEQHYNWQFIAAHLKAEQRFLNLFAYTGAASLVGRATGAEVTHVDAVRTMLDWARRNMETSGMTDIRWVLEDARKFVGRELKRGNTYDLIQMDPPAWGLGAKGEKWRIEDLLPDLIAEALELLKPKGTLIVNTYSPKIEVKDLQQMLKTLPSRCKSEVEELWMESTGGKLLFFGLVARVTKL